jgi:hypothetical protein
MTKRFRARIKTALLIGVLSASSTASPGDAFAGNTPLHYGATYPGSGLGPVFTAARIVPIFWGDWETGNGLVNDPNPVMTWLSGFERWIGGEGAMFGDDPILRQYGIWGALTSNAYVIRFDASTTQIAPGDVGVALHNWQASGQVEAAEQNTVFLVLLNGFQSYWGFQNPSQCADHTINQDGTVYGEVSLDGCTGDNMSSFQRIMSHELEEAMTDPDMFGFSYGWVTRESIGGFKTTEGADQCETASNILPHPDNVPLAFGTVQNFTNSYNYGVNNETPGDGSASGAFCASWTAARTPYFSVGKRPGTTQLDIVYQNWNDGGALEHFDFLPDYTWVGETIDSGPGLIVGQTSLVNAEPGQLDLFARTLGGPPGPENTPGLVHYQKAAYQGFSGATYLTSQNPGENRGSGPPSAVSWGPGRIDVFENGEEGGILHFWSDDTQNYGGENFGGATVGPPVAVSRGSGLLDVLFYSTGATLEDWAYGPSGWTVPINTITDFFYNVSPADVIGAAAWNPQAGGGAEGSSLQVYYSEMLAQFTASGSRLENWVFAPDVLMSTVSVAASQDGGETIMAFQPNQPDIYETYGTGGTPSPPNYAYGSGGTQYEVMRMRGDTGGPTLTINGIFISPPVAIYGSDGYPEVLGVGTDGCLYETWLDYWANGGPYVNGPNWTGICGFALGDYGAPL